MILVFPDGGEFGWYVDSPLEPASQRETMVAVELVDAVDAMWPTMPRAEARGIMGLSMGGHGAVSLAIKHPDRFGSASSLSGILRLENHPDKWEIAKRLGSLEEHPERWMASSVYQLVDRLTDRQLPLLFDCGSADSAAIADNRELHAKLVEAGVPHIWREHEGRHDWAYWKAHLPAHLRFHQAQFIAAQPDAERWFSHYHKRQKLFFDENATLKVDRPTSPTMIIAGSSSAQAFRDQYLPEWRIINRGIAADRLGVTTQRGLSLRFEEAFLDPRADVIVLKIGRNDLSAAQTGRGRPTIEEMIEHYEALIRRVRGAQPEARVVLTSSFPVRDRYARLREPVMAWNEALVELADRLSIDYINVHDDLLDDEGMIAESLTTDGLHLSPAGYAVWANHLRGLLTNSIPALGVE
jgi:lysophospholipase L1-like esterase/dienelactone hydrolase